MSTVTTECVIKDVKLKKEKLGPVLVSFEHGFIHGDNERNLKCGVYTDNGKKVVAAVAEQGDIVYRGSLDEDQTSLCRFFIAVRKKDSNKVSLVEADFARLSPYVGDSISSPSMPFEKKDARLALSQAFGSKRSKRVADQRERMTLNVDAVKHKVPSLINDVEVDGGILNHSSDSSLEKLLPLCNRTALDISHAYPVNGMLSDDELLSLQTVVSQILHGEVETPVLSPFCEHLAQQVSSDSTRDLALLLYMQSLINLCSCKKDRIAAQKNAICPYSDMVWDRILRDFMSCGSQKSRSTFMEDKAITYVIILSFHLGQSTCDVNMLAESLKSRTLNITRIRFIASIVGAVKHSTSNDHVILKFPLRPLPVAQRGSKSKRR